MELWLKKKIDGIDSKLSDAVSAILEKAALEQRW